MPFPHFSIRPGALGMTLSRIMLSMVMLSGKVLSECGSCRSQPRVTLLFLGISGRGSLDWPAFLLIGLHTYVSHSQNIFLVLGLFGTHNERGR